MCCIHADTDAIKMKAYKTEWHQIKNKEIKGHFQSLPQSMAQVPLISNGFSSGSRNFCLQDMLRNTWTLALPIQ